MSDASLGVLRFRAGGVWLGWPAAGVKEVARYVVPTPLPRAPQHLAGLVTLDGRVLTVIDLAPLLGLGAHRSALTRLVVVEMGGEEVAVAASEVAGVVVEVPTAEADELQGNTALAEVVAHAVRVGEGLTWCLSADAVFELARART